MSLSTLEVSAQALLAKVKAAAVSDEEKAAAEFLVLKNDVKSGQVSTKVFVVGVVVALVVGAVVGHVL